MLVGVLYFAITGGGSTQVDTIIAVVFCLAWLGIGFGYLYTRKLVSGVPILHGKDYKDKAEQSALPTVAPATAE